MSESDLETWLEARRPEPPESLRKRLVQAVDQGHEDIPTDLAAAALDRLRAALAAAPDRAAAPDLLAADALLTYACEAAAEAGPEALEALTDAYGPACLAELLPLEDD